MKRTGLKPSAIAPAAVAPIRIAVRALPPPLPLSTKMPIDEAAVCNLVYVMSWFFVGLLVIILGVAGSILGAQQQVRNDVQDLKLAVLEENVTYLDFINMFDAYNITRLSARVAETTLLLENVTGVQVYINETIVLYENYIVVENSEIDNIINELILIEDRQTQINQQIVQILINVTNMYENTLNISYAVAEANVNTIYTLSSIAGVNNNVDLIGVCNVTIHANATGLVTVSGCVLQSQIDSVNDTFTDSINQFLADITMSSIVANTLNGQYPILGNIILSAGPGSTFSNGGPTNQINFAQTSGIFTINGMESTAAGNHFYFYSPNTATIVIQITTPGVIAITAPGVTMPAWNNAFGSLGIDNVNGITTGNVQIISPMTAQLADPVGSVQCVSINTYNTDLPINFVDESVVFTYLVPANGYNYVKGCRYQEAGYYRLTDISATYRISLKVDIGDICVDDSYQLQFFACIGIASDPCSTGPVQKMKQSITQWFSPAGGQPPGVPSTICSCSFFNIQCVAEVEFTFMYTSSPTPGVTDNYLAFGAMQMAPVGGGPPYPANLRVHLRQRTVTVKIERLV